MFWLLLALLEPVTIFFGPAHHKAEDDGPSTEQSTVAILD